MESPKHTTQALLKLFEQAITTLSQALNEPLTDMNRDATIQRFEYSFELGWKTVRSASAVMGLECNSPREAIKIAYKMGWISSPDSWFSAMEARNKTSHTYNQAIALEVYQIAKSFPDLALALISSLQKIL